MTPDIGQCPHRRPVSDEDPGGAAECLLLRRISGVEDARLCLVGRDACLACRSGSTPSEAHLNPTVASLLYGLATTIRSRRGVPGCDLARASALRERAHDRLFFGADVADPPTPPRDDPGPGSSRELRIGLIGWNTPTGLGSLNRDIARRLPVDRWLIPGHPVFREMPEKAPCPVWRPESVSHLRDFLDGLDWLLFCEHPYLKRIVPMARELGVKLACVPMWEYLDEWDSWVRQVDLMISPARYTHEILTDWRERLGLRCDLAMVPWPIDADRFPFRHRTRCDRFLFVHGTGGARSLDQKTPRWDGRKGLWFLAEAARLAPEVSILVRSQTSDLPAMPPNVEVRVGDLDDPALLYADGDVCVQPSRWEGLGLPLLECQASGMPPIVIDAPPMNECRPFRVVPAHPSRARLFPHRDFPSHEIEPAALASILLSLQGADISEASLQARRYVDSERSWTVARPRLLELLRESCRRSDKIPMRHEMSDA